MWFLVALLALLAPVAQAQSDTTVPAITLNAADGSTNFTSLPSPLTGSVFDAGGMGGLVTVRFYRNYNGISERWAAGGWIGIAAWDSHWSASVTATGVAGNSNWSANVPWPTGTNLPRGAYVIGITAIDNAGNRSDISRNVTIGPADTTPPALAITAPVHGQIIDDLQGLNGISGTVNDGDGSGVASVQLYLARTWYEHSQLWNGTAWGGHHKFFLVPGAPDAEGVAHWNLADVPGGEQLGTGHYYIDVFATDRNGNSSYARHVFFVTPDDRIAPTVAVTFPSPDQELTQLPEIRGTSADVGSGVARVEVILVRQVPQEGGGTVQEYWNGTYWSASLTTAGYLPSRLDTSWRRNQSLPAGADLAPGDYVVMCHAIDRYNNVTVAYRNFRIVPVPRLSIDAQIRADESSAWLGEGFSNSDAQGQTLSSAITSGARQTRQLRMVRRGGSASKTVKVTLPDWAQFAAEDWSARFYDAPDGGNDITGQITGASGWQTVMNDGDERLFRAEVTAPAGAEADISKALTFRVEADPTSETPALDVVKATWNVVAPRLDLAIRATSDGAWLGQDIRNESGAEQTVERVVKPAQTVRGEIRLSVADAIAGQKVRWSVPDWDAFVAGGWELRFFDQPSNGNDITAAIRGGLWTTQHMPGYQPVIGIEVTAPADAADVTRAVLVRAQIDEDGGAADAVGLEMVALSAAQPDVSISKLDANKRTKQWVGQDLFSPDDDDNQIIESVFGIEDVNPFAVRVTNTSGAAARFFFEAPIFDQVDGWSAQIYDALDGGNALEIVDGGVVTPIIAPGKSILWRLEVTAQASATEALRIPVNFSGKALYDECVIKVTFQQLFGLEWSKDGDNWQPVTTDTLLQIEQYATVGVRGVKSVPEAPWPDSQPMGPLWSWQQDFEENQDEEKGKVEGDVAWLQGKRATPVAGEVANATLLEVSLPVKIRVLPESDVRLTIARRELMAGSGPAELTTTTVSARVLDSEGEPLVGQQVKLRALNEDETPAGTWQSGDEAPVLTTDAEGRVSTIWTTGTDEGEINFEAGLLTDGGAARNASSHQTINLNAPFTVVKLGAWNEDENGWSRQVKVETWYGGSKLPGLGVALSAAVLDYETEAPVAGWENAAPFDAATGVSDADGNFTTIQRWNPVDDESWPHDFEVTAQGAIN